MIKTAEKRKPIPKKIRFEVFKRDKFTCQYCGRMAPDVVLEVDHITPVAEGGDNNILNLVTSCRDCNRGKGKRELSDDSAIKKQQAMLSELADKNEQLEMMVEWKDELLKLDDKKVDIVCDYIADTYRVMVNDNGKTKVKLWLKKYSLEEIIDATDESFGRESFDVERAFENIPKCAYYKKNPLNEDVKNVLYLRKILINRLSYVDKTKAYALIEKALYIENIPFETLKTICCTCRNWTKFREEIEEYFEDETY